VLVKPSDNLQEPFSGILFVTVVFGATNISYWALVPFVVVMIIAFLFESRCQQRLVEEKIVPALAELETLREKLSAPQHEATELVGK
tara:strand:- start:463 stop:723 length:261 start_codon:yes stop_codon:yes gene_type:complete